MIVPLVLSVVWLHAELSPRQLTDVDVLEPPHDVAWAPGPTVLGEQRGSHAELSAGRSDQRLALGRVLNDMRLYGEYREGLALLSNQCDLSSH
jgi:hypothetical protein